MYIPKTRKPLLVLIDSLIFITVFITTYFVSSQSDSSTQLSDAMELLNCAILAVCMFTSRFILRVYNNVWRYANSRAYLYTVIADTAGGLVGIAVSYVTGAYPGIWQIVTVITAFTLCTLISRFVYQQRYRHLGMNIDTINKIGVAIVGAGRTGALLADDLLYNPKSHYKPLCFIDVSKEKIGSTLSGIRVYAEDDRIIERLNSMPVQEIFIALPELDNDKAQRMMELYGKTNCKIKLYDFPLKENTAPDTNEKRRLRDVKIEDLLFRDTLHLNAPESDRYYFGKTILVTGGGGSIGSELCRQIAKRHPKKLIVLDIYENNAYDLQQELSRAYGDSLDFVVEIGSVRDRARIDSVIEYYRPQIVFHAAAHKHVPLMEHSGWEALKNNVIGTYNTANSAEKYGVEKFILISTDKAVNPTNIMGASKRMCEMLIQSRTDSKTSFTAVRFGNVLGSNGSVIPLFKKQIESGGPITITDKRIIRYFMTIPEASQLVMQAGSMAKSGELFVLDMGKPVKIIDLAETMVRLSGLVPYKDINIVEIGLRPGEKLYEELLIKTEELVHTENNMIFIERDTPHDRAHVEQSVQRLIDLCIKTREVGSDEAKEIVKEFVPTYREPSEINSEAENSYEMKSCRCEQKN